MIGGESGGWRLVHQLTLKQQPCAAIMMTVHQTPAETPTATLRGSGLGCRPSLRGARTRAPRPQAPNRRSPPGATTEDVSRRQCGASRFPRDVAVVVSPTFPAVQVQRAAQRTLSTPQSLLSRAPTECTREQVLMPETQRTRPRGEPTQTNVGSVSDGCVRVPAAAWLLVPRAEPAAKRQAARCRNQQPARTRSHEVRC
jgi:hypothetical protein